MGIPALEGGLKPGWDSRETAHNLSLGTGGTSHFNSLAPSVPKNYESQRARKMRSNRRSDTKPEISLRSLLRRSRLRFRKDYPIQVSSGRTVRSDIAFTRSRMTLFVDGCFWHGCPEYGTIPKSNEEYWAPKLKQNVDRDRATVRHLRADGWKVLRFWKHVDPEEAKLEILSALERAQNQNASICSCHAGTNGDHTARADLME